MTNALDFGGVVIRLEFPNPQQDLRVGMSCVLRVHNLEKGPQITIPGRAVVEQMGEYFVFIAKDTIAVQVKVSEGQTIGSDVIITKGLKEGDRIVVDGAVNLTAAILDNSSYVLRALQNGLVQHYALSALIGVFLMIWAGRFVLRLY